MKILFVSNLYPRPDEPQRGLFNAQLALALSREEGHSVSIVVLVPEWRIWRWPGIRRWRCPFGNIPTTYVPCFYAPAVGRNFSWRTYGWTFNPAAGQLMRECDVVLATWLYPDAVVVARHARRFGKKVFVKVHGTDTFHLENAGRRRRILQVCDYAAGILPNCEYLARKLVRAGVNPDKIHVIPSGVDGTMFKFRDKEEAGRALRTRNVECGAGNGAVIVLFVGNLVPVKGPDIMLEAWAEFARGAKREAQGAKGAARGAGAEESPCPMPHALCFLGDGPMRGGMEQRAKSLGIEDSVTFLGNRPQEEVALWMNAADCLCVPSRSEGMPNVALEALASGLPVVATDVGGCAAALKEEPGARVVAFADRDAPVHELAESMSDILTKTISRRDMAERHSRTMSWDERATKILSLMKGEE